MKKRLKQHCRPSRTRGLTLIEVVAAIAILGTLLVGVVLAKSRHTRQLTRARAQADAVAATDALLAAWWTQRGDVPIGERGVLPGDTSLRWSTRLVNNAEVEGLGARVVRVEVFSAVRLNQYDAGADEALVSIDLVVPDPQVEAREAKEAETQAKAERAAGEGRQ